ncbi:endopeptidase La [Catalinimonas niigatensis]|uniref:endopeptidase La n=1 Tax=Catalinimonas niigatensis TaxID=1397264 RepID=UPI0026661973|nr:endopeptidase La [Catalinimonas niigatensis]WPP49549.1 endopeptidase La [Catalinimonas niigatensis]
MKDNTIFESILLNELHEGESEDLIRLVTSEGDDDDEIKEMPSELPILPIRNTVLFPGVVIPITVGRKKSIKLVKNAYEHGDRVVGVVAQKDSDAEEPDAEDIYKVGTVAKIIKMLVLPDGSTTIIIQGKARFKITSIIKEEPYMLASISLIEEHFPARSEKEVVAVVQSLKEAATKILRLNPEIPQEAQAALDNIESPSFLTHFLSSNINAEVADKQKLLETNDGLKRAKQLLAYMYKDIQMLEIRHEIHSKVHSDIDQQQRDYFLRQQMKVLQDELGDGGLDKEMEKMRVKGEKKKWPEYVAKHFNKELDKLSRMNPMAAEYPVSFNYVEFLLDLPWTHYSKDSLDLKRAKKILDKDHYGLEKVKDRIIEYLAVLKMRQNMKGPILCLYGPPGVGKTSLGKSIARALNRKYCRLSLGGVSDEAEIRGHRKTYVGAMPGKIISNLKKAKTSNPVFVLDEIDKVNSDFRGDPSSALLEVLDPEQNDTFLDNYLEVEYDLSNVLFIATANSLDTIHHALRDRMEIIELTGYTIEEKIEIAKKHLVPKQRKEHGLNAKQVSFDQKAIQTIIENYTRESGVRSLERKLATVIRNVTKSIALEEEHSPKITAAEVEKILGAPVFDKEIYEENELAGVVTGLAWTQAGGEILFIESSLSRGKGKLTLSGQLGDVMKESAMTALSYLKSNAEQLGINYKVFDNYDLHLHIPAGAVPKDGPSAGITMLTAMASVYTQRKVKNKMAMTGEITLRGKVMPVGGIKEKILAARRAGVKDIILCDRNRKDVEEIGEQYTKNLNINYIRTVSEVLDLALLTKKVKNPIQFVTE